MDSFNATQAKNLHESLAFPQGISCTGSTCDDREFLSPKALSILSSQTDKLSSSDLPILRSGVIEQENLGLSDSENLSFFDLGERPIKFVKSGQKQADLQEEGPEPQQKEQNPTKGDKTGQESTKRHHFESKP